MTVELVLLDIAAPALILVLAWLMPGLVKPTLPFAVRVPPQHADDPVVVEQRRVYRWWVGVAGCALVLGGLPVSVLVERPLVPVVLALALLGVVLPGYAHARRRIQAVKASEGWYHGMRQGVVTDTALRTRPERFPWAWAVPAVAVLVATAVIGAVRYDSMPAMLALHYGADATADRFAVKSVGSAFGLVFIQLGLTTLLVGLAFFAPRFKPDLDPAQPVDSARRHRAFTVRMSKALALLAACMNAALLVAAWQIWNGAHTISMLAVLVPVLAGLVGVVVFAVRTGQEGSRLRGTESEEDTGVVRRDDDRYWHGFGGLYANRDDPAVFVPKRFGIGWTVNFANPRGVTVLVVVLAAVLLPIFLR
jgi:uncharacterized membrane protein